MPGCRRACAKAPMGGIGSFRPEPRVDGPADRSNHERHRDHPSGGIARERRELAVNKITWTKVGQVTEPGRYSFTFGWLTITAEDLAIWEQYPTAEFTLYSTVASTETGEDTGEEEFRLGTFELRENI